MLEVSTHHAGCQPFDHILEAALRQREDFVAPRRAFDWLCDQLDRRTAINSKHVDEGLKGNTLRGLEPPILARACFVCRPVELDVGPQRHQEHVDEAGRGCDQVLACLFAQPQHFRRTSADHLQRFPAGLPRIGRQTGCERTEYVARLISKGAR